MRRVLALVVLVVVAGVAGPAVGVAGAADAGKLESVTEADETQSGSEAAADGNASVESASPTIRKQIELHLTPEQPGAVDVVVTYDVPEELTSLSVQLPSDATDVRSQSFSASDGRYEWDESSDPASIRFTMPANDTISGSRSPSIRKQGTYAFVDVGKWALVTVPSLGTKWGWRNADTVTLTESVTVAGEGSTGGEIAYLGPVETHKRTANDQTFTLVVPKAASMRESPDEVLDALAGASTRLRVGARDDKVWFVAAPSHPDWGVRGVEYGGNDAWVLADSSLSDPGSVWFHEYVHTRQDFSTAESARWITEGSAEYYAAFLGLRGGFISFEQFQTFLAHGERRPWRNAILADPSTWERGANYVKGSLVTGEIDRRIRLATDSSATMADVVYALNREEGQITNGDFLLAVASAANGDVAAFAERFTETRDVPQMWDRQAHQEAFSTVPARMMYEVEAYRVTGPFRNETYASMPTLYVGETLTVEGLVRNDGGATGTFSAELTHSGEVLAADTGELAPADTSIVMLRHQFTDPGSYTVTLGRRSESLQVAEPTTVSVQSLSVSDTSVESGETVTVTVELTNPTEMPATGPVAVTLDGEQVASVDASLGPGESATRQVSVTVESDEKSVVAAGDKSVTLNAQGSGGDAPIPGFGIAGALAALAAAGLVAVRER